jgi:hypothetical protein
MADEYWEFYRKQSKILKDRKVKFDEPGGKVRHIADLWKGEKAKAAEVKAAVARANAAEEEAKAAIARANAAEEKFNAAFKSWEDIKRFGDDKIKKSKK